MGFGVGVGMVYQGNHRGKKNTRGVVWVLELVYQGNRQGNWACTSLRCGCEVGVRVGSVGVGLVLVSFGVGFRVGSGIV